MNNVEGIEQVKRELNVLVRPPQIITKTQHRRAMRYVEQNANEVEQYLVSMRVSEVADLVVEISNIN